MAIENGYTTAKDLQRRLELPSLRVDDLIAEIEEAVENASRDIDTATGQFFYQAAAGAKTYGRRAIRVDERGRWIVEIDPAGTIATVEVDDSDSGTWTATSDYITEPAAGEVVNGITGWPKLRLVGVNGRTWRRTGDRPSVRVTTSDFWGWAAIPVQVKRACELLAVDELKLRETALGVVQYGELGLMRIRENARVLDKLRPLILTGRGAAAPSAW